MPGEFHRRTIKSINRVRISDYPLALTSFSEVGGGKGLLLRLYNNVLGNEGGPVYPPLFRNCAPMECAFSR